MKHLEPSEPKTIYDYELMHDRDMRNYKEKVLPISFIQEKGVTLPFKTVFRDMNYKRPAYTPNWHSTSWRWCYVPDNIANQQHIMFSYTMGLSWLYDLSGFLALPDKANPPSPLSENAFTIKYPYVIRLFVFNFNISTIKYYRNQIVIIGIPLRKGLTTLDFDVKKLPSSNKLLQLATPEGYEVDSLVLFLKNEEPQESD